MEVDHDGLALGRGALGLVVGHATAIHGADEAGHGAAFFGGKPLRFVHIRGGHAAVHDAVGFIDRCGLGGLGCGGVVHVRSKRLLRKRN